MARVVKRLPQARLLLVGEGPERAKVEQLASENGLERNVQFLGLRTDIPQLLAAADLFLLTSISEGIPVTLIEAMAAGLPIVSTRVGGVPEIVIEGETGVLAEAGDDAGLAEQVVQMASQPQQRTRMSHAGRQRALAQFSDTQMDNGYLSLYEEMLSAVATR